MGQAYDHLAIRYGRQASQQRGSSLSKLSLTGLAGQLSMRTTRSVIASAATCLLTWRLWPASWASTCTARATGTAGNAASASVSRLSPVSTPTLSAWFSTAAIACLAYCLTPGGARRRHIRSSALFCNCRTRSPVMPMRSPIDCNVSGASPSSASRWVNTARSRGDGRLPTTAATKSRATTPAPGSPAASSAQLRLMLPPPSQAHSRAHSASSSLPVLPYSCLPATSSRAPIVVAQHHKVRMSTETPHTVRRQPRTYQFLPDLPYQGGFSRLSSRLARRGGIPGAVSCTSRA